MHYITPSKAKMALPSPTMETLSHSLLATSCLLFIAILMKILLKPGFKLPPGPRPWPIIGNLNLITDLPHQSFHNLSKKYGPIMQLKLGSIPVVIASSCEMAKSFLKTHDQNFASRPKTAVGKYITYNYSNITWSPYGPYWRQGRKIFLTQLFSPSRLESYHHIRVEERLAFTSRLYGLSGKPILMREHLSYFTLSIMSRVVLGKKYINLSESKCEKSMFSMREFENILDELFVLSGVFNIGDWIPWLGFLDLQGYVKQMKALGRKIDRFLDHVFDEHRARRIEEEEFVDKDMVDVLLKLVEDHDLDVKLTYDSIKAFTLDLIAGGTDTSATSVEWAMSELLKHPHIIKKATEELDRVVGMHRWVEEKDIPQLPYLDAIMKETVRLHPVVVFLAPHLALEDSKVAGYDIKKGTRVFINTWSIGRDPSLWDAPEEFYPERFLGKEIDMKGQSFELLPFGSGRRMCPGYNLGLKMTSSGLASMLHGFNWSLPDNMKAEDLNMDESYGLVTVRKSPLVAIAEPRLPMHLY